MAQFLSAEWLAALAGAVAGVAEDPAGEDAGGLRLGQVVTGAPGGDVAYTLLLGNTEVGSESRLVDGIESAEVVLVEDYETAAALATGRLTAAAALTAGRVKVRGAAGRLVESEGLLALLAGAVADITPGTSF